ncbi:MAG TPA: hypothetical protein VLA72_20260 [Anaerolineales bacterium]|nr:hypothetical protein [Anaerolineales bacterium]
MAHCFVGMIERVASYWLFQENEYEIDEVIDALVRFELYGISSMPA